MATTKKILLGLLSIVMAFCLAMVFVPNVLNVDAEEENGFHIDFSDVDMSLYSKMTDTVELADGNFIILATTDKVIEIDGNSKAGDGGMNFTQRLKLGGRSAGDGMNGTVAFYLEQKAKITVYAYSPNSSDATRKLNLYKNGTVGDKSADGAIAQSPAVQVDGTVNPFTWETTEEGSYYIGSAQSDGVNIYYIGVEYTGEADPVVKEDWANVANPTVGTITASSDGVYIQVPFNGVIGPDGADYVVVKMRANGSDDVIMTRRFFEYGNSGLVKFNPANSGTYSFEVELYRKGEVSKYSALSSFEFTYNLYKPTIRAKTVQESGNFTLEATVSQVNEADYYTLTWADASAPETVLGTQELTPDPTKEELTYVIPGLTQGKTYVLSVTATRTSTGETTDSVSVEAVVRNGAERDWQFRYFGTSTKEGTNYMENGGSIYDGLTLHADGTSAGKFTYGYFDGISYYFTQIKANEEDFKLKARISLDYINPNGNGQEGFALLVRDSIGDNGSSNNFYTNSAAAISTKVQQRIGTQNVTQSPGIGARFVTGVTNTNGIGKEDTPLQKMYLFDKTRTLITGEEVIFEVEKKNNVYYARYYSLLDTTVVLSEKTLFHTEEEDDGDPTNDINYDPLCQIDKENVYVGFAVARSCTATFSDIEFDAYPKSTDYIEIVPEPIAADSSITSPTTTSLPQYKFSFYANSNGILNVYLNDEFDDRDETKHIIFDQPITADEYWNTMITLTEEVNKFTSYFEPEGGWKTIYGEALDDYDEQFRDRYVTYKTYGQLPQALVVAPVQSGIPTDSPTGVWGSPSGTGALNDPLDLQSALNYVLPGQTIYMLEGIYTNTTSNQPYTVEKGNDGRADAVKTLAPHPSNKTRPVLDYKTNGAGFTLWGDYWHLCGFDITRTADGKKGLQIGGHYCLIEDINAYENGDTGIQVSGKSTDMPKFWPSNNLILNCTSYSNMDSAEEDADGFGAKLYCGVNNVFRGCMAYCNVDDGWDLYAKTESGNIGAVVIENCITFGNGFTLDGKNTDGNGNGFKLGGENLSGHHVIRNSISIANKAKGIDSNSCPDIEVYNCTSLYNGKYNFAFYVDGGNAYTEIINGVETLRTAFKAANNLSLLGIGSDKVSKEQIKGDEYILVTDDNYFYYDDYQFNFQGENLTKGTYNKSGAQANYTLLNGWENKGNLRDSIYNYFGIELDGTSGKGVIVRGDLMKIWNHIYREEDGSLAIKDGYFALSDEAIESGATLEKTSGSHAAPITLTFKNDAGEDFTVTYGTAFTSDPEYIEPTDGNVFPDFEHTGNNPGNSTSNSGGENPEDNGGNLTWLFIVLGAVVVIGAAAACYFLVIKKKKNN